MKLEDAMLEAILRDVLANPGKYPYGLVALARHFEVITRASVTSGKMSVGWPKSTQRWAESVSEFLKNRDLENE